MIEADDNRLALVEDDRTRAKAGVLDLLIGVKHRDRP
jgi:hypothetical protein